MTGTTVTPVDITVAAEMIDDQTDHSPDEHNTVRAIEVDVVRSAWAIVAARVHTTMMAATDGAVTSETQGDYSYTTSEALAKHDRFADVTDGMPSQLLNISKAVWSHI
jgi:hypothetical protein